MSLSELIKKTQDVVTCDAQDTVQFVARLMAERDVGCVVITEQSKLCGIVTDRDLAIRCLGQAQDQSQLEVSNIMTSPVETIGEEAGIHELIALMQQSEVRRIVIVDQSLRPIGVVSVGDVVELLSAELNKLCEGTFPSEDKLTGGQVAA